MRLPGIGSHHSARPASDEWLTPPELLAALGPFDLDPCSPPGGPLGAVARYYTADDDGLTAPWAGRVWLNPPYSEVDRWMARMAEHRHGIALVFARCETRWWFEHVWPVARGFLFLKGRLSFHRPDGSPSKAGHNSGGPSVLVAYTEADLAREANATDLRPRGSYTFARWPDEGHAGPVTVWAVVRLGDHAHIDVASGRTVPDPTERWWPQVQRGGAGHLILAWRFWLRLRAVLDQGGGEDVVICEVARPTLGQLEAHTPEPRDGEPGLDDARREVFAELLDAWHTLELHEIDEPDASSVRAAERDAEHRRDLAADVPRHVPLGCCATAGRT